MGPKVGYTILTTLIAVFVCPATLLHPALASNRNHSCMHGWQYYTYSCYFFSNTLVTRSEAQRVCRTLNAQLAMVEKQEELFFIWSSVSRAACRNLHPNRGQCEMWEGLGGCRDRPANRLWMNEFCHSTCSLCVPDCDDMYPTECKAWVKEGRCPVSNWVRENCARSCGCNEKDNHGFWVDTTDLGQTTRLDPVDGKWLHFPGDVPAFGYVCERDEHPYRDDLPWQKPSNQIGCLYGYEEDPDVHDTWGSLGSTCFESKNVVNGTFEDAELKVCHDPASTRTVVSVHDQLANAHVASLMRYNLTHWLGLTSDAAGRYRWMDGTLMTYHNWNATPHTATPHSCVVMLAGEQLGLWEDSDCNSTYRSFSCQSERTAMHDGKICPTQWRMLRNSCHRAFVETKLNWADARSECQKLGGDLAYVDEATRDFFDELSGGDAWIGLRFNGTLGKFHWCDGNSSVVSKNSTKCDFCPWGPGQPLITTTGACVRMVSGQWFNEPCTSPRPFVCSSKMPRCRQIGWEMYEGYCYLFVSSTTGLPQTWKAARKVCHGQGADLTSVWSERESLFIGKHLLAGQTYWVGLNEPLVLSDSWVDGSILTYANMSMRFDQGGTMNHREGLCIHVRAEQPSSSMTWAKSKCSRWHGYVCKRLSVDDAWLHPFTSGIVPDEESQILENQTTSKRRRGSLSVNSKSREAIFVLISMLAVFVAMSCLLLLFVKGAIRFCT